MITPSLVEELSRAGIIDSRDPDAVEAVERAVASAVQTSRTGRDRTACPLSHARRIYIGAAGGPQGVAGREFDAMISAVRDEEREIALALLSSYRPEVVSEVAVELSEESDWDTIATWCGGEIVNTGHPSGDVTSSIVLPDGSVAGDRQWITLGLDGAFRVRDEIQAPTITTMAEAMNTARRVILTVPKPVVPYGPVGVPVDDSTADYLDEAARKIPLWHHFEDQVLDHVAHVLRVAAASTRASGASDTIRLDLRELPMPFLLREASRTLRNDRYFGSNLTNAVAVLLDDVAAQASRARGALWD